MRDILDALARHAQDRPNAVALHGPDGALSYEQLARRTAGVAARCASLGETIGILAPNSVGWMVCDLGLALAGKTMVPLPPFFSPGQLGHIARDAGVEHILCAPQTRPLAEALGISSTPIDDLSAREAPWPGDLSRADTAKRIIYTSGTTGTPKGVRIGAKQIAASAHGLFKGSGATENDLHLSVLPFALLLEQIAAICVPLLAGAPVALAPDAAAAAQNGDLLPLHAAFEAHRPTTTVLVPALLGAWVQGLKAMDMRAPDSLRFVAVGGAHVPPQLAEAAWNIGIPVHEGYGLSECCSVVSVNRPDNRVAGTAGQPLDGLDVRIEDGEIVVRGATVMDGYLGRDDVADGVWRTGDLGKFTDEGALVVLGRWDRLIVTPQGRNIHPEWIETIVLGVSGVGDARLSLDDQGGLLLDVTPGFATPQDLESAIRAALADVPDYARPARIAISPSPNAA